MLLNRLVDVSNDVARTRSRLEKRAILADCLRAADPDEIELVVDYLSGQLPQGRIGLGPAIVYALRSEPGAATSTLTIGDVDRTFTKIAGTAGKGSAQKRRDLLGQLYALASDDEQRFLARLILGELRQGALEAVLVDAIADACELAVEDIRRAVMLAGGAAVVAGAALRDGPAGLSRFRLAPMSPVKPMLAQPAEDAAEALASLGEASLEYKLDGARVQIHRVESDVKIFTRRLKDVTESLPDVVEAVLSLPVRSVILDGEVITRREDGRPYPFQVTMRRFGRKSDVDVMRRELPLDVFLFDCLHRDGADLIDETGSARHRALAEGIDPALLVPRVVTGDPEVAGGFLTRALADGHEGIMAKSLESPYAAGSRGADWLKVKQAHTLDLVVLAAEWGSGRRKGWLSNLHLGARDPRDGTFVMLGKTFKGLTDRMLEWQTGRLLELELGRENHVVHVRPELVAEIAVNEIQASPQYPAGLALRFARVKRYRDDKTAAEADTIDTVRKLYTQQTGEPAPAGS